MATRGKTRARERVAYHEAGHAVAHIWLDHLPALRKVTIVPSEDYLGFCERHVMPAYNPEMDMSPRDIIIEHLKAGTFPHYIK